MIKGEKTDKHVSSLLSLVPSSCMIVPVRDLGNKFFSSSSNMHSQQVFNSQVLELPTVFHSNNAGINIFAGFAPDNYNEVRDRTLSTKEQTSRNSSISLTKLSIAYYERMECNNAMNVDINMDNNSLALSYETSQKKAIWVSKVADFQTNIRSQCGNPDVFNSNP